MRIFQSIVEKQTNQENTSETGPRDMSAATVEFYNDLNRLKPLLQEEKIDECFELFLTLWNNPQHPGGGRNRLMRQRGVLVLSRVAAAKIADMDNQTLPSVARITQLYHELESLSTVKWAELVMGLIKNIITRSGARADYESYEVYKKAFARKEELLDDLVESWAVFNRHRLSPNLTDLQSSEAGKFRLAPISESLLRDYARRGDLVGAMSMIFNRFAAQHQQVPAAAVATFVLMVDPNHSTVGVRRKIKPLLDPIARILTEVDVRLPALGKTLEPYPEVLAYILTLWDTITRRLRGIQGPQNLSGLKRDSEIMRGDLGRIDRIETPAVHAHVTDALKMGDVAALETVWKQYWEESQKDVSRKEEMKGHKKLFDYFVMAFTALKRPQRAVDVWEAMVQVGIAPTLETWTSMIEGCRRSRNAVGLENVWKKLVASGQQLDYRVWSARIVGLMDCREPEAGLRALSEMQKMSKLEGGVPLSVDSINAAVAGLIRLNAMPAAQKVLTWGSEHGIDPDVVTFNTLLRPLVARSDGPQVAALLRTMGECGIQPDGATYTILLEGLISSTRDAPPEQQRRSMEQLILDIKRAGIRINMETLARMIHLLICDSKHKVHHTQGAVGVIYDYIHSQGLRPSVHIYTMLVTYYMSLTPPAVAHVDQLLADSGLLRPLEHGAGRAVGASGRVDRVFWERLIKGYAQVPGHVGRAFELFQRAGNAGAAMTLDALETLVRRLVGEGRAAEAKHVVDTVKTQRARAHDSGAEGAALGGRISTRDRERADRYWNHGFWVFAHDRGLLSLEEWKELEATTQIWAPGDERGA